MSIIQKQGFTLLFHGDSITHGGRQKSMDCNHILGHGYAEMVSAALGLKFLSLMPRFVNRGVPGRRLEAVVADWEKDVESISPDVLTLLIGVNDAWHTAPIESWAASYRTLLHGVRARHPEMPIVLMEPFYFPMLPGDSDPYESVPHPRCEEDFPWPARQNTPESVERNAARVRVMQKTVAEVAAETGAIFIPTQEPLARASEGLPLSYLVWDGVHTTVVGHRLLANAWLAATAHLFE